MNVALNNHIEFEKLMAMTERQAYNMAYRMTGNRDDAKDLVQDAYVRAYRFFDTYDRSQPFDNWFFRILSNLSVDRLRRRKLIMLPLDQYFADLPDGGKVTLEIPDLESNPETIFISRQVNEQLHAALNALPEHFRGAIILCDVQGYKYEEIAKKLGCSIGTVRSRVHRGRKMMRASLNKQRTHDSLL